VSAANNEANPNPNPNPNFNPNPNPNPDPDPDPDPDPNPNPNPNPNQVRAANNEAKARLQLSALRNNRSQMHQEADSLSPPLFSKYAATSNLGQHANP
jgi:hypothetical protein